MILKLFKYNFDNLTYDHVGNYLHFVSSDDLSKYFCSLLCDLKYDKLVLSFFADIRNVSVRDLYYRNESLILCSFELFLCNNRFSYIITLGKDLK